MRAYGKHRVVECPDVADIQGMGAQSHVGALRRKGGDYRGYLKSSSRRQIRRAQKGATRGLVKRELQREIAEL